MQAIETKYIGPSNVRGSRIKASCERGSLTVSYDDGLNSEENHIAAAKALVAKFVEQDEQEYGSPADKNPWAQRMVTGGTKKGYCHVIIEGERTNQ